MTSLLRVPVQAPVETEVVTDADVLHRAADLIEEFGWCQWALARNAAGDTILSFDGSPCGAVSFCELGALVQAGVDFGLHWADVYFDQSGRWGDRFERIAWNDTPGRTKQEVVQRLRDAAEKATS